MKINFFPQSFDKNNYFLSQLSGKTDFFPQSLDKNWNLFYDLLMKLVIFFPMIVWQNLRPPPLSRLLDGILIFLTRSFDNHIFSLNYMAKLIIFSAAIWHNSWILFVIDGIFFRKFERIGCQKISIKKLYIHLELKCLIFKSHVCMASARYTTLS